MLRGHYLFEQAQFRYQPEDPRMALRINRLEIRPGEKVAILGRNGAGKSTLLQAMAGGMDLVAGELRLDNLSLPHLDVADVRRNVGFMTQNARLFYGTLRENITLGMPRATDEEIFEVLEMRRSQFCAEAAKGAGLPDHGERRGIVRRAAAVDSAGADAAARSEYRADGRTDRFP